MKLALPTMSLEIDYWKPTEALVGLVSGYHRCSARVAEGQRQHDVFFPGWANLRFHLSGNHWHVTIAGRSTEMPSRCLLFGPTSHAMFSESDSGVVIGAGLTPRGWRRLTDRSAADVADRVVPLNDLIADTDVLLHALASAECPEDATARLDSFLRDALTIPHPDEERVDAIHRLLMVDNRLTVEDLADAVGLSQRQLANVTRQSFGFTPKLLLRRTRFLRSLLGISRNERFSTALLDPAYSDYAHFLRDCRAFLGMPPREFLALPKPLFEASRRMRDATLGAPAQALAVPA